jgi:hypothetical protein
MRWREHAGLRMVCAVLLGEARRVVDLFFGLGGGGWLGFERARIERVELMPGQELRVDDGDAAVRAGRCSSGDSNRMRTCGCCQGQYGCLQSPANAAHAGRRPSSLEDGHTWWRLNWCGRDGPLRRRVWEIC